MRTLAIRKVYPEVVDIFNDGLVWKAWDKHKKEIELDEKLIKIELEKLQAAYDLLEFQRLRKLEYPSIEECVHAILDDNLEELQAKRLAVKEKYPKPELKDGN